MSAADVKSVSDSGKRKNNSPEIDLVQNNNNNLKSLFWLYFVAPVVFIVGLGMFFSISEDGRQMLASMHIFSSSSLGSDTLKHVQKQIEPFQDTLGATTKSFENAISAVETINNSEVEKWDEEPVKSKQEEIAKTEEAKLAIANLITSKSGRSFIIAGGFSNKKNAVFLREKLILEGFESKIIAPTEEGALYRVTLGDYPSKTSAMLKIKEFKPNFGNDIWVMVY
jgi:cell division septation protein DedD